MALKKQRPAQGASDPLDELMATKTSDGMTELFKEQGIIKNPNKLHDEYKTGNLARRMATENMVEAAETADEPTYAQKALGGVASFIRRVPFAEKAAALVRAPLRGENYDEALSNIRQGEASSGNVGRVNALTGGAIAGAATPGSPALAGARYGVLEGLGAADRMTPHDRLASSLKSGAVNALTGKAIDVATTGVRAAVAKPLDDAAILRKNARKMIDKENYGKVDAQTTTAAQSPTDPAVLTALGAKETAPIEKAVRASRKFATADDYTVAREVFKRMSALERGLTQRIASKEYEPALETTLDDLRAAKADLAAALDGPLPSLKPANAQHAKMKSERAWFNDGADAGRRLVKKPSIAAKNLETRSPAAFRDRVPVARPNEADAAREGLLSSVGDNMGLTLNPKTGFGIGPSVAGPVRATETLRLLDQAANKGTLQHGLSIPDLLRSMGIVANPFSQP